MTTETNWRRTAMLRCEERAKCDAQVQRAAIDPAAMAEIERPGKSSAEIFALACRVYEQRPCLGRRDVRVVQTPEGKTVEPLPSFHTISFGELWRSVQATATGLDAINIAHTSSHVGICGFGSIDWAIADFACLYLGSVSVPLATAISVSDLQRIIQDAQLTSVFCSTEQVPLLTAALPACKDVRHLVVMDLHRDDEVTRASIAPQLARLTEHNVTVHFLEGVIQCGEARKPLELAVPGRGSLPENPLLLLLFTSGSTGTPKGAMYTERVYLPLWERPFRDELAMIPTIGISYLPLSHGAARILLIYSLVRGGTTYFTYKSDLSTWFEDLRLIRPTFIHLVPRASELIYQHFQTENVKANGTITDPLARAAAAEKTMASLRYTLMGERVTAAYTSAAPTSPEVAAFIATCFDIPVIDIYGSTENGGFVTVSNAIAANDVTAYKLSDVPELGYTRADKPFPRGELCVKTHALIPGYFNNPTATEALFDAEGFMMTGDIMEERTPGSFHWVDRRQHVLKLSQGEFVNTARLEGMFIAASAYIEQIYVYGNSMRSYVLAVVVPNMSAVHGALGADANDDAIRTLLRGELDRAGTEMEMRGYEIPRDFLLTRVPFSADNGLLTESNKPARAKLRAYFGPALEAMYQRNEARQRDDLQALYGHSAQLGIEESTRRAVQMLFSLSEVDADRPLRQLGGDSMSAVELAQVLEDLHHVDVPASFLLHPATTLRDLVKKVSELKAPRATASFASIHGAHAAVMSATDLAIERFMSAEDIRRADAAVPPVESPTRFLLTGATGFLGRFVLHELLGRGAHVDCIVREKTDAAAQRRLRESFLSRAARQRFDQLAAVGTLEVHAGDLSERNFGLPDERYEQLSREVDAVVHVGALVNHALSYQHLFEPNVLGTAEVIRFALHHTRKPVSFASTSGLAIGVRQLQTLRESDSAATIWSAMPNDGGYGSGYLASKWAGELLLDGAHARWRLPITILRSGTILGHPELPGEINRTDYLTRLLHGVVHTKSAPKSFYVQTPKEGFDGLPVDFLAKTVAALAADGPRDRRVLHLVGCTANRGVDLDTIARWVRSAGYTVDEVADYASWYTQLIERLDALDERQRAQSALPGIQMWAQPQGTTPTAKLDVEQLERAVSSHPALGQLPTVSERLVHEWLKHMAAAELISRPPR